MSMEIPERFQDGDDAHEDVTAPKNKEVMSMNQSIFSMIARAGQQSQTDLAAMREVDSGDSDDEGKERDHYHSLDGAARLSRISTSNDFHQPAGDLDGARSSGSKHRRALSDHKLLRSLPKLKMSSRRESKIEEPTVDRMSSSQFLPPKPSEADISLKQDSSKHKSKGSSQQEIHVEKRRVTDRKSRHGSTSSGTKGKTQVTLAYRLQQIFEFDDLEEVISGKSQASPFDCMLILTCVEYPCWLLQSILLQGYMYITQKHICFYAYIPKKHVSFRDFYSRNYTYPL